MATEWETILPPNSEHDQWGLRERRLSTNFCHLRIGFSSDPLKNDDWARRHALKYGGFEAPKWRREQKIDYKAHSGQRIWPMLSEKIHSAIIDTSTWTKYRVIDQGIRHPMVCLWVAVNKNLDRHIYKEFYATGASIAMNCRSVLALSEGEDIAGNYIDPSTKRRNVETLKTTIQVYEENGLYCSGADNSFVGYDAVTNAALATLARYAIRTGEMPNSLAKLKPSQDQLLVLAAKPALTFDSRFTARCFDECRNLRWQETKGDMSQKAERETPVDKEDDGPDCVRYSIQSPLWYSPKRENVIRIADFSTMTQLKKRKKDNGEVFRKQRRRAYL